MHIHTAGLPGIAASVVSVSAEVVVCLQPATGVLSAVAAVMTHSAVEVELVWVWVRLAVWLPWAGCLCFAAVVVFVAAMVFVAPVVVVMQE